MFHDWLHGPITLSYASIAESCISKTSKCEIYSINKKLQIWIVESFIHTWTEVNVKMSLNFRIFVSRITMITWSMCSSEDCSNCLSKHRGFLKLVVVHKTITRDKQRLDARPSSAAKNNCLSPGLNAKTNDFTHVTSPRCSNNLSMEHRRKIWCRPAQWLSAM